MLSNWTSHMITLNWTVNSDFGLYLIVNIVFKQKPSLDLFPAVGNVFYD